MTIMPAALGMISVLALSGCVSSAVSGISATDSTAQPANGIKVAQQASADGQTVPELEFERPETQPSTAQVASTANVQASAGQIAPKTVQAQDDSDSITTHTTMNAVQGSIFATQPAKVEEVIQASQSGVTVPAFVPLPTVNPAVASLYGSQAVQPTTAEVSPEKAVAAQKGNRIANQPDTQVAGLVPRPAPNPFIPETPQIRSKSFDNNRFESEGEGSGLPKSDDGKPHATLNAFFPPAPEPTSTASAEGDQDDEDSYDGPVGFMRLVSAPSMARVTPEGIWIQSEAVETDCFKPSLVSLLHKVENHFKKPPVVTSGYRPVAYNRSAGGASHSLHTTCDAADIQVKGVSKWELANFVRSLPERGGVGTYCYTNSVHLDTGSVRDWNWRCRRNKK